MSTQATLFDDEPDRDHAIVRLGPVGGATALTKAQKRFNRWIRTIEAKRRELAEWQSFAQSIGSRIASELDPLRRQAVEQRVALLRLFDAAHAGDDLTRRDRSRLGAVIRELAVDLLESGADPVVIAVHDKYADVAYADLRRGQADAMKALVGEAFGMPFDIDDDLRTPEDVIDALHRRMDERDPDGEPEAEADFDGDSGPERPRSARSRARLDRERAAADGATRSVRELFRKLASALHPDREPDPTERARKTALMQRVNQAYGKQDLLQLLMLQIEAGRIDLTRLAEVGDARLEHYNRVLKEQAEDLDREIRAAAEPFVMDLPGRQVRSPTPAAVLDAFQREIAALRRETRRIAEDIALLRDPRQLKAWLKTLRVTRSPRPDPIDEIGALIAAGPGGLSGFSEGAARWRRRGS